MSNRTLRVNELVQREINDILHTHWQSESVAITVTEVRGFGKQKGFVDHFRGNEIYINLLPKIQLVIVVKDDQVRSVVETIMDAARTGEIGDGKIFVTSVEEVYRIRTGEAGEQAV